MSSKASFKIYQRTVSSNMRFLKPFLAGLLFLGIGAGLIALYTKKSQRDMMSYKDFKESRLGTSLKQEEELETSSRPVVAKSTEKNEFKQYDLAEGLKDKVLKAATKPTVSTLSRPVLELIQKGMRLSEEGKHNSAEVEFEKAAKLSPTSPEVHAIWATALRIAKKYQSADKHFKKADKLAPNDDEILLNWGMTKLMAGNIDEAIKLIESSIKINPDSPMSYNYLGKAFGRKKDYNSEILSYNKALDLEPNYAQAHFNLAVVLSLKEDFDGAAEHFKRAIQLDFQFNKPFVQRFLAQYDAYKSNQEGKSTDSKSNEQTLKIEGHKIEEKKSEGSGHDMEGSGHLEKEFTKVRGIVKVNGKPLKQNGVVFLETKDKLRVPGQKIQKYKINQHGLQFEPRHSVVMVGSTITFINQDAEVHNIYSKSLNNQFNLGAMAAGISKTITIKDSGPIVLRCNMHKDMLGTIFAVPNGYYTLLDPDGSYAFDKVKSKEYLMQVWAPRLNPSEVEANMKSIGLTGKDAVYDFDIKSEGQPGEIHDIVDKTDYNAIVNSMEVLIYDAIASWNEGKKYKPRKQMLIAITKHFDGEGLKGAIAKSFSEKRSAGLESKLDSIRKKLSGLGKDVSVNEQSLKNEAALVISQLRLNVQELEARVQLGSPKR